MISEFEVSSKAPAVSVNALYVPSRSAVSSKLCGEIGDVGVEGIQLLFGLGLGQLIGQRRRDFQPGRSDGLSERGVDFRRNLIRALVEQIPVPARSSSRCGNRSVPACCTSSEKKVIMSLLNDFRNYDGRVVFAGSCALDGIGFGRDRPIEADCWRAARSTTRSPTVTFTGIRSERYPHPHSPPRISRFFIFENGSQHAATLNQVNRPGIITKPITMMMETTLLVRRLMSPVNSFHMGVHRACLPSLVGGIVGMIAVTAALGSASSVAFGGGVATLGLMPVTAWRGSTRRRGCRELGLAADGIAHEFHDHQEAHDDEHHCQPCAHDYDFLAGGQRKHDNERGRHHESGNKRTQQQPGITVKANLAARRSMA